MIDFRAHILPSIDDGAPNSEVSQKMIELLKADGVSKIVCTPHFCWRQDTVKEFLQKRERSFQQLHRAELPVVLGAEVEFGEFEMDYSALIDLKIGETRYIMIELPFGKEWTDKLYANIDELIDETDLVPVVAHVEKYAAARKKPRNINRLIEHGCVLQVDADSIIESKPYSLVDALLKGELVQAIGSNCRNAEKGAPRYKEAVSVLKKNYGEKCFENIRKNMLAMLENEPVWCDDEYFLCKRFHKYY